MGTATSGRPIVSRVGKRKDMVLLVPASKIRRGGLCMGTQYFAALRRFVLKFCGVRATRERRGISFPRGAWERGLAIGAFAPAVGEKGGQGSVQWGARADQLVVDVVASAVVANCIQVFVKGRQVT